MTSSEDNFINKAEMKFTGTDGSIAVFDLSMPEYEIELLV
jgi:hypothetical protein